MIDNYQFSICKSQHSYSKFHCSVSNPVECQGKQMMECIVYDSTGWSFQSFSLDNLVWLMLKSSLVWKTITYVQIARD